MVFRIGRDPTHPLKSVTKNMPSARDNPQVIEDYLHKETQQGNIFGPIPPHKL